ncbi:MAG: SDR family NAD(P)-dependent oxidoreductase [Halioglobus sp.]
MATNQVSFNFDDATVLVTGGTSGIGYAIATAFADAGADVTVTGTRADTAAYADDDVDLQRFTYVQADMRDAEALDALAARFEVLDVLVNNAGTTYADGLDEWTVEGFAASLDLNLKGAFQLTTGLKSALAASALAGGASVINIASMSAFRAVPIVPAYSACKAALVATTRNMALAWMEDNIRVNAIAPGLIRSRMTSPMEMEGLDEVLERELARIPAGRMGTPQECAAAALFLASAASSYTSGISLAVDGGYLAF